MIKSVVLGTLAALLASALTAPQAAARENAHPAAAGDAERSGAGLAAERAAAAGIDWGPCARVERLPEPVECGTVSVPVDYAKPDGEALRLHLSRLRATGTAEQHRGPLLYNPGGPGGNGMLFPLYPLRLDDRVWQDLSAAYDLVGFAPRGVGRSAPISCMDPAEFIRGPRPAPRDRISPSAEFKRQKNREAAAYAAGCHADQGTRLAHFSTLDSARDLHVLRAALGEPRLAYLGVSYGSYLGAVYATLFPRSVGRMVLDSIVDPSPELIWYRSNLRQSEAFEDRWDDWKTWVADHHDVYGLGRSAPEVQRVYDRLQDAVALAPLGGTVGPQEVHDAFLTVTYADSVWAHRATVLAAYHRGSAELLHTTARPDPRGAGRAENSSAVYTAVECNDAPWPRDWETWDRDHSLLAPRAPFETWDNAWMNLPCAHWPVPSGTPLDVGAAPGELPPTLLVQATGDAATPYTGALELHRRLPDSTLVTEAGAGQHGVTGGNECVDALVLDYLLSEPAPGPPERTCPARPGPTAEYLAD